MSLRDKRVLPHPDSARTKEVARHRDRLRVALEWIENGCPKSLSAYFKDKGLPVGGARKIEQHPALQERIREMITYPARRALVGVVARLEKKVYSEEEMEVLDLVRSGDFLDKSAFPKKREEGVGVNVTISLPQSGGVHLSIEERQQISDDWEKQNARIIDVD